MNHGEGISIQNATLNLRHETISCNTANDDALGVQNGGGCVTTVAACHSSHTIIADNQARNSAVSDVAGAFASGGFNLIGITTGSSGWRANDLTGLAPLLGALRNNGRPTPTLYPLPGSPIINAGDPALFSSLRVEGATYWDYGNLLTSGRLVYTAPSSALNTWTHWALVSTRAGNAMRIYRNGAPEASTATNSGFMRYAASLVLGARLDTPQEFFKGDMDEFRIWTVARTPPEIQATMRTGLCQPQPNLWVYWKFDEASGMAVLDHSGNGRHGTLVNGTGRSVSFAPLSAPGTLTIGPREPDSSAFDLVSQLRLPAKRANRAWPVERGPWRGQW